MRRAGQHQQDITNQYPLINMNVFRLQFPVRGDDSGVVTDPETFWLEENA